MLCFFVSNLSFLKKFLVNNNLKTLLDVFAFDNDYGNDKKISFLNRSYYNNEVTYGFTIRFGNSSIGKFVDDTYWITCRYDGLFATGIQVNGDMNPNWNVK